jgi:hypothetical protein
MIPIHRATAFTGYPAPAAKTATASVTPLDVYPVPNDSLKKGDGWAGINKPVKVAAADGTMYVAKSNTLGLFAALHPDQNARKENVHEIVASHIMADEFKLPSLTFQEGFLNVGGQRVEKILSPLCTDIRTLEDAKVTDIKDGDTAVALTIVQGWMGDWDSTFNDSNVWVKNDGQPMGSDYGYALNPGVKAAGIPFANRKIMQAFATQENVTAITDKITSLSDKQINEMVDRVGKKWIHDWSADQHKQISGALIANRDAIKKHNPYLAYVDGFHPVIQGPLAKMRYPRFFWTASKAKMPPLNRPDQFLDVMIGVSKYARLPRLEAVATHLRKKVLSPEEKAAKKP